MASVVPDVDVPALLARLGARPQRITADSRLAAQGVAFAAFPGTKADGRDFIGDALTRGAVPPACTSSSSIRRTARAVSGLITGFPATGPLVLNSVTGFNSPSVANTV